MASDHWWHCYLLNTDELSYGQWSLMALLSAEYGRIIIWPVIIDGIVICWIRTNHHMASDHWWHCYLLNTDELSYGQWSLMALLSAEYGRIIIWPVIIDGIVICWIRTNHHMASDHWWHCYLLNTDESSYGQWSLMALLSAEYGRIIIWPVIIDGIVICWIRTNHHMASDHWWHCYLLNTDESSYGQWSLMALLSAEYGRIIIWPVIIDGIVICWIRTNHHMASDHWWHCYLLNTDESSYGQWSLMALLSAEYGRIIIWPVIIDGIVICWIRTNHHMASDHWWHCYLLNTDESSYGQWSLMALLSAEYGRIIIWPVIIDGIVICWIRTNHHMASDHWWHCYLLNTDESSYGQWSLMALLSAEYGRIIIWPVIIDGIVICWIRTNHHMASDHWWHCYLLNTDESSYGQWSLMALLSAEYGRIIIWPVIIDGIVICWIRTNHHMASDHWWHCYLLNTDESSYGQWSLMALLSAEYGRIIIWPVIIDGIVICWIRTNHHMASDHWWHCYLLNTDESSYGQWSLMALLSAEYGRIIIWPVIIDGIVICWIRTNHHMASDHWWHCYLLNTDELRWDNL